MDNINKFIKHNPKYLKLQKPLEAARVCEVAKAVGQDKFDIISYHDGLLSIGISSGAQAADIQMQSVVIIKEINEKLKDSIVKKIRYKIQ